MNRGPLQNAFVEFIHVCINTNLYLDSGAVASERRAETSYCMIPTPSLEKLLLPTMDLIRSLTGLWGEGWDEGWAVNHTTSLLPAFQNVLNTSFRPNHQA